MLPTISIHRMLCVTVKPAPNCWNSKLVDLVVAQFLPTAENCMVRLGRTDLGRTIKAYELFFERTAVWIDS